MKFAAVNVVSESVSRSASDRRFLRGLRLSCKGFGFGVPGGTATLPFAARKITFRERPDSMKPEAKPKAANVPAQFPLSLRNDPCCDEPRRVGPCCTDNFGRTKENATEPQKPATRHDKQETNNNLQKLLPE